MYGIERDRMQDWKIVRVSGRAGHRTAISHVLYPASAKRRHKNEMQHDYVLMMIHRLHRMWFSRVKDLIANNLWFPTRGESLADAILTFRRIMNCRPSCVYYRKGNRGKLRPCKHTRFCPFCWGRVAAFGYRNIKKHTRRLRQETHGLKLTVRTVRQCVPAPGFHSTAGLTQSDRVRHATALRAVLEAHREEYKALTKQLQRTTLGSAVLIVVDPQEAGWNVETRQIFLHGPKRIKLPMVRHRDATTVYRESICAHDDESLAPLIGQFFEYPAGLMTSYVELSAVYLDASHGLRLTSGTGVFRTVSDGLFRKSDQEQQDAPQEQRYPGPCDQHGGDSNAAELPL